MRRPSSLSSLLALAACAVALGVGAAPASATVFCKTNVATCSAENTYPLGSEFSFSLNGNVAVLESVAATHKCKKSTIAMKTEKAGGGGALLGNVTSLTFGECSVEAGFGECLSREVRSLPWQAEWIAAGGERRMVIGENGSGKPDIRMICFSGFTCDYGSARMEARMPVVSGVTHLQVEAELPFFAGSPLCATKLFWKADYNLPSPEAVFLTQ